MTTLSYQLYSSRNFPPVADTLKMLADIGYTHVEGFGGLFEDVPGLRRALDDAGVTMSSCHVGVDLMIDQPEKAISICKELGVKKMIAPFLPADRRPTDAWGWTDFGGKLAEASKPLQDAGFVVGWHNHDFEVMDVDGQRPLDLIAGASEDLMLELDVAWVVRGGEDPLSWIDKYAGRITAAHAKDIAPAGHNIDEDGWADVGHGTMDWDAISAALKAGGCDHFVAEHDNPKDHARFARNAFATISKF